MIENRPIYVIDTNVIIDYVDVIPDLKEPTTPLDNPTVDLSEAHIVIPSVVTRELSSFKNEGSERGKVARKALRRIRDIAEATNHTMDDAYHLRLSLKIGKQVVSLLPIHKNFAKGLPFYPADNDMDGQIILAALTIEYLEASYRIDGGDFYADIANAARVASIVDTDRNKSFGKRTVLLTNDNGLAIRARERGILTSRYGYKYREPYTGRRDIVVPSDLYAEMVQNHCVTRKDFESAMPGESRLIANEFIVMSPMGKRSMPKDYNPDEDPAFSFIGRYDKEKDKIVRLRHIMSFPVRAKNPGQAMYAEALQNDQFSAVICKGPAGSGKTFMVTVYGYVACQNGRFIGVTVVPCETSGKTGALPGPLEEKMDPDVQPQKNALRNYLLHEDEGFAIELRNIRQFASKAEHSSYSGRDFLSKRGSLRVALQQEVEIIWEENFISIPVEKARGRDFAYELAVYDEFQDQTVTQADMLIKRLGEEGKIVITGDVWQIHNPYLDIQNNGLVYASELLFDNPRVAQVCFRDSEVVRHPLVQAIARRQEMAHRHRPPSQQVTQK